MEAKESILGVKQLHGNFYLINVDLIKLPDWSCKNDEKNIFKKLRNSVFKNDQNKNILVRETTSGKFEVIKGKKLFSILKDTKNQEILCYNYGFISDIEAKIIYLENNIFHSENYIKSGSLIKEILEHKKDYEIEPNINYSLEELVDLVNLAEFDWEKFKKKEKITNQIKIGWDF